MRALELLVLLATACSVATPPPSATPRVAATESNRSIGVTAAAQRWVYAGAVLLPPDPNVYANVLLDAKPLRDGGWVVLRQQDPRRGPVDPTVYGGGFGRPAWGRLERLDATGHVVAVEHGREPFGLQRLSVFEDAGVVIGEGQQVLNGTVHAFRLDTLDGIASELTNCIPVASRCWSYRTSRTQGGTALEERDPRTLAITRSYPQLTMDGLDAWQIPAIYPIANVIAWRSPDPAAALRVEPLDPTVPIALSWLARLRTACDLQRLDDDRAVVQYGPPGCRGDTGWDTQLIEVSTGRVIRDFGADASLEIGMRRVTLADANGALIDPRDGAAGPVVAATPLDINWSVGRALAPLADGGAAILERRPVVGAQRDLSFVQTDGGRCVVDFPRVSRTPPCSFAPQAGGTRLFVIAGRGYFDPTDFDVTRITADDASRTLTIEYRPGMAAGRVQETAAIRVIDLDVPIAREWLVKLWRGGQSGDRSEKNFVLSFP